MQSASTRPSSIVGVVVCCLLIGWISCVSAAGGVVGLAASKHAHPREAAPVTTPDLPVDWVTRHALLVVATQGILAMGALFSAIGVWMRSPVARIAAIVTMSACAASWVLSGLLATNLPLPPDTPAAVRVFAAGAAIAVSVFWGVVAALPAWLLTRSDAVTWFRGDGGITTR
jgi:hypothetical protein